MKNALVVMFVVASTLACSAPLDGEIQPEAIGEELQAISGSPCLTLVNGFFVWVPAGGAAPVQPNTDCTVLRCDANHNTYTDYADCPCPTCVDPGLIAALSKSVHAVITTDGIGNIATPNNNGGRLSPLSASIVNAGVFNAVRISFSPVREHSDYGVLLTMKGVTDVYTPTYGGKLPHQVDVFFHDKHGNFVDPQTVAVGLTVQILP